MFAGTSGALYQFGSGNTWDDVSDSGGYTLEPGQRWHFAQFDNHLIATCGLADPVQVYDLASGTAFGALDSAAPKAKYCATIAGFLMLGYTSDGTYGTRRDQVW
jgi:hypothetical protein